MIWIIGWLSGLVVRGLLLAPFVALAVAYAPWALPWYAWAFFVDVAMTQADRVVVLYRSERASKGLR